MSKNATVPVKVAIFHVYYHGQNADRQPFPADFSIISGNPNLTEDEARAQGGIGMEWVRSSPLHSFLLCKPQRHGTQN